jgi:hypothetical protein
VEKVATDFGEWQIASRRKQKAVSKRQPINGNGTVQMNSQMGRKGVTGVRLLLLSILVLFLLACAASYKETICQWKSYKDLANWMKSNFEYDFGRFNDILEGIESDTPRDPSQTFELKSGAGIDGAYFAKKVLNRINPTYEAKVVFIKGSERPESNHYVCSFKKKDGKLYIMDYATPYTSMRGIHGPFNSLQEYKEYYEGIHPKYKGTLSIKFVDW